MLAGKNVGMVLHLGPGRLQSLSSWTLSWGVLDILLVLVAYCLLVIYRFGIILVVLLCASLLGSCLGKEGFRLWLVLPLSLLVLDVVVQVPVGLEELEVVGRECDSPRKRPVLWFGNMGIFICCGASRWKRLHASGDFSGSEGLSVKRGRLTLGDFVFPRVGVG